MNDDLSTTKRSLWLYGLAAITFAIGVVGLLWRREYLQHCLKSQKTQLQVLSHKNELLKQRLRRLNGTVNQRKHVSQVLAFIRDHRRAGDQAIQVLAQMQKYLAKDMSFRHISYGHQKLTINIQGRHMSDLAHYKAALVQKGINIEIKNWVKSDQGASIELELRLS